MIKACQIELVQASFAAVLPFAAAAAKDFYRRLFQIAPEVETLFHSDLDEQGRKLFLTLATVVDSLDRLDDILPVAEALAIRHVAYGVQDAHYSAVGSALLQTLNDTLGGRFDADTEGAWLAAYQLLASRMTAAAQQWTEQRACGDSLTPAA